MSDEGKLIVMPSLRASTKPDGRVVLTRKFIEGVAAYVERWPGSVVVCMPREDRKNTNLDLESWAVDDLPFEFTWLGEDADAVIDQIRGARIVLASRVDRHVRMAAICARMDVPLVLVCEYSVDTRKQMIRAETSNPLLRWRRERWTTQIEKEFEQAVRFAAGVQCNGTPVFEEYRRLSGNPLLYFDSRVRHDMVADSLTLKQRTDELRNGAPLRLAFSGRLIRMKGADHLVRIAASLKKRGLRFSMGICGGGELEPVIATDIRRLGLGDHVRLHGVLDFESELMPYVSRHVDLFVCCHRQGDPSCTYLETMACGTPIVGYDNDAFTGIAAHSHVGWTSPMDDIERLAMTILDVERDRDMLTDAAFRARDFAARHTFEDTMQRRVDHLIDCSDSGRLEVAS
jgi:glycosyltransferase involved in cell wall biosynthesis